MLTTYDTSALTALDRAIAAMRAESIEVAARATTTTASALQAGAWREFLADRRESVTNLLRCIGPQPAIAPDDRSGKGARAMFYAAATIADAFGEIAADLKAGGERARVARAALLDVELCMARVCAIAEGIENE